ncbi:hypothetical protein [Enterococcus faecalis]|jgi:hypothetical protein|uniref:hypothetical protein n=1 Tax=Enterococcus TaxID=1350 RepID=UPI000B3D204A|nr:hypothetical protein [Enterococcus faecalis]ARV05022.1 hypothetical protein A6B47_14045 [Enterococcus faecalis]MBG9437187.1 hypothetical protein [Enterococcus faecalis]MBG9439950.1 hypothetical protein [Enterococcus faecalis]MBG9442743.1 hypothetical protein [Enterococcus faecalis]MDL4860293.1 hypothetical protein [Enterococcus faecalis]
MFNKRVNDEELMERLKDLGTFYYLDPNSEIKDYTFDLNLSFIDTKYNGFNDFRITDEGSIVVGSSSECIDIQVFDDGSFELGYCRSALVVTELENLQKLLSIVYGSIFSVELKRVDVGWVKYEVRIPMIRADNIYQLEDYVKALRHVLVQILNNVKLDR